MLARKLTLAAAAATLALGALPALAPANTDPDADGVSVCNEAENSPRGGYVVTDGPVDPSPPAFLRGSPMSVGNGDGTGLVNAAEHSPALRVCAPEDEGGGGPGDGDDGGDDPLVLF